MELSEVLSFVLYGLATVLGTLTLLALLCAAMGAVFQRLEAAKVRAAEAQIQASLSLLDDDVQQGEAMSPELLVVLSAAAESVLDSPVRVVRIESRGGRLWAQSGRKEEHATHRLR
jgi:Na+-transporting methylmalonyl-CoA/oxaloacetate decarboxylase gamma subunit